MPWHRFIFTKAFWSDETPVYVSGAFMVLFAAVAIPALILGAPVAISIPFWLSLLAFFVSLAVCS
jgi:Flp pilus assembly protein TadG